MNIKTWDSNEKIGEYLERKIVDSFAKEKISTAQQFISNTKAIYPNDYFSHFCKRLIQMKQFAYPSNTMGKYGLLPALNNAEYEGLLVADYSELDNQMKAGLTLQQSLDKIITRYHEKGA